MLLTLPSPARAVPALPFLPSIPYADLEELPFDGSVRIAEMMTADEERTWFRQMQLAIFQAEEIRARQAAGDDDETLGEELQRLLLRADAIRNELARAFLRLNLSIAARFANRLNSFDELASEGYFTLLRALPRFDPERGFRFSTYAMHSIRRRLLHFVKQRQKERAAAGAWPNDEPILETRRWTLAYEQRVTAATRDMEKLLAQLSSRERYVIRSRFGWGREFDPRTLQEIADELGVTRERIRQLEHRALKKLRALAATLEIELDTVRGAD